MNKFWMLIRYKDTDEQQRPFAAHVKHHTRDSVWAEAKRLAALHPGEKFVILEARDSVTLPFEIETLKPNGRREEEPIF